jgi:hypothetical protein
MQNKTQKAKSSNAYLLGNDYFTKQSLDQNVVLAFYIKCILHHQFALVSYA